MGKHLEAVETSTDKCLGGFHFNVCLVGDRGCGLGDLGFERFVRGLVLLHLDIPSHQSSGEAGILPTTPDGLGKFFFVHLHGDGVVFLVDFDRLDLRRLERLRNERVNVVAPADDIDLLVVQLADDVLDACPAQTNACAHRIDLLVGAVDSHLGPVASLTGEGANLDSPVGDFADLGLEETTDEIGMAARKNDLRSTRTVLDCDDVGPDAVPDVVFLGRNPLTLPHDALELAQVDKDVATLEPSYGSADDIPGTILELVVDHFLLRLAQALHHRLLRGLGGNPPEVCRGDIDLDFVFDDDSGLEPSSRENVDLVVGIIDAVTHDQRGKRADVSLVRIDVNPHLTSRSDTLARGRQKSGLESFHHGFPLDPLLLLVILEKC